MIKALRGLAFAAALATAPCARAMDLPSHRHRPDLHSALEGSGHPSDDLLDSLSERQLHRKGQRPIGVLDKLNGAARSFRQFLIRSKYSGPLQLLDSEVHLLEAEITGKNGQKRSIVLGVVDPSSRSQDPLHMEVHASGELWPKAGVEDQLFAIIETKDRRNPKIIPLRKAVQRGEMAEIFENGYSVGIYARGRKYLDVRIELSGERDAEDETGASAESPDLSD